MKVVVMTLGCKVNKYESDSLLANFKSKGYEISDKLEKADIYVINSCAVTNEAERKSRQMITRCKKLNPDAKVIVCGCSAQHDAKQYLTKQADLVKGVSGKDKIADEIDLRGDITETVPLKYCNMVYPHQFRTRAYLKIQDGCNNFCTYCIIPYLRGRSRSRDVDDIIREVENLPNSIKEIVVVGINVSDFKINGKSGLLDLLQKLDKYGKRIRLGSMEDCIISEEFMAGLAKLNNFCPHFHMSLQSGCDSILKKMNRHYTTYEFEKTVEIIRKYFPFAGITTDVIVGFPGETDDEFGITKAFVQKIGFSRLHIFPYSKREGTVASKMIDLPMEVKRKRFDDLEQINQKLISDFITLNQGRKLEILVEEKESDCYTGYSKNYIKCYFEGEFEIGEIVKGEITQPYLDGVKVKIS